MEILKPTLPCALFGLLLAFLSPGATEAAELKRVLVLGDSLTKGYGLLPEQAYPALLQEQVKAAGLKDIVVLNGGVSGDTTAGGLRRMKWLMKKRIDVLVIALGGNDGLRGIAPEETTRNLQEIIETARASNPKIELILAGMEMPDNMGEAYTKAYRAIFPSVAKKNGIALIPLLLDGVGGVQELNQPDLIHPNEKGQKKVSATVWKALKPVLEKIAR